MASVEEEPTLDKNFLECPVCHIPYDNADHEPKLLSCHDSLCLACVRELAANRVAFGCPKCQKKTKLPAKGGISALQTNFYIKKMLGMMLPRTRSGSNENSGDTCAKHINQPMLFFCETCMVPICMNCTVLDHDRQAGHHIKDIRAAIQVHKDLLRTKMEKVEVAVENKVAILGLLRAEMGNLETANTMAKNHLDETFAQLKAKMDKRKEDLAKKLNEIYVTRKEEIFSQAQLVKSHTERLEKAKQEFSTIVDNEDISSAVKAANNIKQMDQIEAMCQPTKLKGCSSNFLQYKYEAGLQDFIQAVQHLGDVSAKKPLPSNIHINSNPTISCIKSTINIKVETLAGGALKNYPITAEITDPCGDVISNKIQGEGEGIYMVKYRPEMPGNHTLKVKFLDMAISGTERVFPVHSNNPVLKIGGEEKESDAEGQLYKPTSVVLSKAGNVYVADMGNKRIQVFNPKGKYLAQFKPGSNKATTYDLALNHLTEELMCSKVAPDETGRMVAHTVVRFGLTGEKRKGFTNPEMINGLFLAVNSKGWILVADPTANCLYVYSKEGMPLKKLGSSGDGPGQFNFPSAITTAPNDDIIVTDTRNNRIQVLSKDGVFIRQIGEFGNKKGQLKAPRGVAIDKHGQILVADTQNRIQLFKYDGTYISCIDSSGDKICEPYNLAVTDDGHVFVADFKNNCVKKYRYM